MPAACGLACEVCGALLSGGCILGGCVAGTDPKAPEKLEKFKAATGQTCLILECAINKNQGYCLSCAEFPCDVHYKQELYSKKTLDMIKAIREKRQKG
jgi:hypothetical protein